MNCFLHLTYIVNLVRRLHKRNPDVIALATLIGRSVNAVSWKLVNFARLDPALRKRGIKGASHGGKGEIEVWNLFHENWEKLALKSCFVKSVSQLSCC